MAELNVMAHAHVEVKASIMVIASALQFSCIICTLVNMVEGKIMHN